VSPLNTGPVAVATWCVGLLRAAADTLASGPQTITAPAQSRSASRTVPAGRARAVGAGAVTSLVYELLDAHDDTARMASELELDPLWQAHLEYLRALQRKGRETLARLELEHGA
jgi:hypothetical protein